VLCESKLRVLRAKLSYLWKAKQERYRLLPPSECRIHVRSIDVDQLFKIPLSRKTESLAMLGRAS
jgi:hypothetical protein